jgi:hypothetical protein
MLLNVPVVTDVLVAGRANVKANNSILTPILRLQATKMWRRQNTTKGKARLGFCGARAAACRRRSGYNLLSEVGAH